MSNKQNPGYDSIKKMLNTMRNLNENVKSKNILKEEDEKLFNLVLNDNVEVKIHSTDQEDLSISDEEKASLNQLIQNFKSQVSELANFEEGFNIYVDSVRLDGTIENDLSFVLIAGNERGLYVNANMLKIEAETVETISKLEKFQHSFEDVVIEIMNNRKNN
jgi:ribonuclease HII